MRADGDDEANRVDVDSVSAASSAASRESWVVAKAEISTAEVAIAGSLM